ncbi:integrative conjugative element protein, RAQPRD family [Lentisalinibacter orientalis]|uniref:integrative conjugative element protein, RAQPRD family n=1 Tax=Lentisalinibacter orientalis TaxID=2992241 RepID=UPI00386D2E75
MHGSNCLSTLTLPSAAVLALTVAAFWPIWGDAGTYVERGALARLIHEIEALEPLIEEAEAQASPNARIRFRYDWLRQDLDKIQRGIEDHLEAPSAEPRPVPPLRGDYRQ